MHSSSVSRSTDSNASIMLTISGGICLGLLPFAIYRFIQGDLAIATMNSIIVMGTAFIFSHLYFTKNTQVASAGIVMLTMCAMTGTILLKGATNVHWVYPAITTTFYLMRPTSAAYINLVFITVVIALIFKEVDLLFLLTFGISAGATFLFAFAFSNRMFRQAEILEHLATTDALTGIGNRRKLEEKLIELARKMKRYPSESCSLVIFDLDYFKRVNDRYGHGCGDELLHGIAELVSQRIREVDSLYRLGGEEFVLVLENTRLNEAENIAEKLLNEIEKAKWKIEDLSITSSAGIAEFKNDESTYDWMKRADRALYKAKESGRNSYKTA